MRVWLGVTLQNGQRRIGLAQRGVHGAPHAPQLREFGGRQHLRIRGDRWFLRWCRVVWHRGQESAPAYLMLSTGLPCMQ